jgi:ubiquinone/menaquinone biosynthesis C-methylase UbiE
MTEIQKAVDSRYLHLAAEHLRQDKERTYSWMHLQPGYSVLDVGCGPGSPWPGLLALRERSSGWITAWT